MSPPNRQFRFWTVLSTAFLVLGGGQLWAEESPWYVAARFGESSVDAQLGARFTQQINDEAGTAAVDVGYEINRYLAVEAGYQDLGSHAGFGSPCRQTDDNCPELLATFDLCAEGFACTEVLAALDAEISGFSLALVPSLPLGDRVSLRGKVGMIAWDGDVAAPSFGFRDDFSGEELLTGIGLEYSFPTGLGLLLQHEEMDFDVGATSFGLSWRF